jgi:hypothetical protein
VEQKIDGFKPWGYDGESQRLCLLFLSHGQQVSSLLILLAGDGLLGHIGAGPKCTCDVCVSFRSRDWKLTMGLTPFRGGSIPFLLSLFVHNTLYLF